MNAADEARLDFGEDGPTVGDVLDDNDELHEILDRLRGLIDRHTTTSGEHPITVAELRYAIDPESETWDPGDLPWRVGTCSTGCTPEDFS